MKKAITSFALNTFREPKSTQISVEIKMKSRRAKGIQIVTLPFDSTDPEKLLWHLQELVNQLEDEIKNQTY